jgi:PAS domain S-box-containing protein
MTNAQSESEALRRRAEEMFRAYEATIQETLSPGETKHLLHELRVHQIELEMQNEELRRTKHELRESWARYFDLYDLAPVGYLTLNEQGVIQEANLAAATMLGMERSSLVNQPISRSILKEDQDIYYLHRRQLVKTGKPQACDLRLVKMGGTAFWVHLAASAVHDPSTNSRQDADIAPVLRIVLSDITEPKRAEEALFETNRQLKEATVFAHEMAAKSEVATRVKSQFLANMSHELRTPMTGVLGMLDLVLLGNLEAEQREFIKTAYASAHFLIRILNDILDMTKIEFGKLSLEEKSFSIRECLENTISILLPVTNIKGLNLDFTVADNVPEILVGDQKRLNQVLTNLVGNAVKFTEKGRVELRVTADGGALNGKREVTFIVTDTGIGIPADKRHLLFHSFSQVDESHSREYGGTGLGLAISKEIVERMGGTISFTSEEGEGSTFSCTIPLGTSELERAAINASEKTATAAYVPRAEEIRKPRLLIAEDDPTIKQVLGVMLQRVNYEIGFADDGQKAVEKWESEDYDLILMDVQMPCMNGFEATAAIREKERTCGGHIPIVAMTAHALKEDEEKCLAAGMDAYISKPIDFQRTLLVIAETLKKHVSSSECEHEHPDER